MGWSFCGVRETDGWIEGNEDRLLYWPITSSKTTPRRVIFKAHLAFLLLHGRGYYTRGRCRPGLGSQWLQAGFDSRLALTPTDSDPHAYIISSRQWLPINHTTASAYLLRWVLFREISDWPLRQGSIYNNWTEFDLYINIVSILFMSCAKILFFPFFKKS